MVWYFSNRELQQEVKRFTALGFNECVASCGDDEIVLQHNQEKALRARIRSVDIKFKRTFCADAKQPEFIIVWDIANKPIMCNGVFIETYRINQGA